MQRGIIVSYLSFDRVLIPCGNVIGFGLLMHAWSCSVEFAINDFVIIFQVVVVIVGF